MNIIKRIKNSNINKKTDFDNNSFILGKDESLKPKFTTIFDENYSVNVYYLRISSPELNLEKNSININLPMNYRKNNNQDLLNVILLKMYKKIAENEIENIMEEARHVFGFAPENYEIKKIAGTLAYCNTDLQSFIINPYIVMYSKEIIKYIIFHEFCHLKYKSHGKKFYEILQKYVPNYEKISKQIPNLKY